MNALHVGQRVIWSRDIEVVFEVFWVRLEDGRAGIRCGSETHVVNVQDLEVA